MKVNLNDRIQKKYIEYGKTPLSFQEKIIKNQVVYFFENLIGENKAFSNNNPLMKEIIIFEDFEIEKNENLIMNKNSYHEQATQIFSIINIDVGLGKTITSLISVEIITDILYELEKEQSENFNEKVEKLKKGFLENEEISFLNLTLLETFIEKKEELSNKFSIEQKNKFPIWIIARKSIVKEFEHLIHQKTIKNKYVFEFLSSSMGLSERYFSSGLLEKLRFLIQFNLYAFSGRGYSMPIKEFDAIIISDEWGTDKTFFGKGNYNEFINRYRNFVIGLTANADILKGLYDLKSRRYLKSDPDVMKELVEKKLYSFKDFIYKFISIGTKELNSNLDKIKELKENSLNKLLVELKDLNQLKSGISFVMNEIFSIKKEDLDTTISKIIKLKQEIERKNAITLLENSLNGINSELERYQSTVSNLIRTDYYKIFEESNLQYLSEKNTVIVVDNKFSKEQFSLLKQSFKENEFNLLSLDSYKTLDFEKSKGNVLIGQVADIGKGLNLQNFDAIIFSYLDNISLEDVYQGIGRLDRLGLNSDKEILLMSYNYSQAEINNLIEYKDKFNKGIKLNVIKSITELVDKDLVYKLNDFIKTSLETNELISTGIKENFDKLTKEEEKRLKDKVEFIQENKKIFKEMLGQIDDQYNNTKKTIQNLLGGEKTNTDELDKKYLDSVLSIL